MTLQYPETDAAPTTYPSAPPETSTAETIVPVYARKPPRSSAKKKLIWIIPVVAALGVSAWALTLGGQSRTDADPADTEGLTTSRLSTMQTEAPAIQPAEPLAVQATPAPDAVASTDAPSLREAPAPVTRAAPARRAPAPRPAARAAPKPAPLKASPLPQESLGPVIVETTPAPATVAPVPTLPVEPTPQVTPPATETTTGPGQA